MIAYARSIRPPRRDSIMNGADDDGSGTVVLLEIAEKFATEKPARSIIFVSHEGEEAGLLGSRWFTDHPTIPLDSVVAAHNMDMVGKGRVTDVAMGGPASVQTLGSRRLSREFGDIIDSVNAISKANRWRSTRPGTFRQPAEPLLPQRPGELRASQRAGHVLLARLRAGLPPADRRAAVHRLRARRAAGPVHPRRDDRDRESGGPAEDHGRGSEHAELWAVTADG